MDVERVKELETRLRMTFCVDSRELRELTRILRVNLRILAARLEKCWHAQDWGEIQDICAQFASAAQNVQEEELADLAGALTAAAVEHNAETVAEQLPNLHMMLEEIGVFDDELLMHE